MGEHFSVSPLRLRQVPNIKSIRTTKQVLSTITEVDDMKVHESEGRFEDPMFAHINPDVFQYDQGQHQWKRVARHKQWQERKQWAIRLRDKWENLKHNGKTVFERKVQCTRMEHRIREAKRLEHWVNLPYDFGTSWAKEEAEMANVDCQAEGLQNILKSQLRPLVAQEHLQVVLL